MRFKRTTLNDGKREWILLEPTEEYIRHAWLHDLKYEFADLRDKNVLVSGKLPNWYWLAVGAELAKAGAANIGIYRPKWGKFQIVYGDLSNIVIKVPYEPEESTGVEVRLVERQVP